MGYAATVLLRPGGSRMSFRCKSRLALFAVFLSGWLTVQLWGADSLRLAPGEHHAPVNDVQLRYMIAGHGPLVFICSPGWGSGLLYLQRGLAPLEERFTLLFIDTRGSGKPSRPADVKRMSASDMADDIEAEAVSDSGHDQSSGALR